MWLAIREDNKYPSYINISLYKSISQQDHYINFVDQENEEITVAFEDDEKAKESLKYILEAIKRNDKLIFI